MTPEQELLDTIEEIRKMHFPELPAELVKQVVEIERNFSENRAEAYRRVTQAIDSHVAGQTSTQEAKN